MTAEAEKIETVSAIRIPGKQRFQKSPIMLSTPSCGRGFPPPQYGQFTPVCQVSVGKNHGLGKGFLKLDIVGQIDVSGPGGKPFGLAAGGLG